MEEEYHVLNRRTKYLSERQAVDLKLNDLYPNIWNLGDILRLYLLSAGS